MMEITSSTMSAESVATIKPHKPTVTLKPYPISGFTVANGFHPPRVVNSIECARDKKLTLVCQPQFEGIILVLVDRERMRVRKGRLRLSPNEEAALLREETEKRRKLRLQQVREQSKENAAQIRKAVKQEKHRQLMKLANDIKCQLESEKAERVRHLEQQYDNSLRNIGAGHKHANNQPDWSEERERVRQNENLRAEARGRSAVERLKRETDAQERVANKVIVSRRAALEAERERAREVAAMPPPPPDPLHDIQAAKPKPVKVMDMTTFSTSHYHLQNDLAVDRAEPDTQPDAGKAAELEEVRIADRALELRQLRHDQLERARLRHNQALEKELLKHDYNNILHDLSDLQRADRDRRLKVVHHIPKQVFEPPNCRLEDREDKQRALEQHFEDMYMAHTDQLGDLSMALDPRAAPTTPSRDTSLDVSGTGLDGQTPLQEPSLPHAPPVLRDMTNMQQPAKKPEKVLRNLMNRIKSQREEWMTSHSMLDVGDAPLHPHTHHNNFSMDTPGSEQGQFHPLLPEGYPSGDVPVSAPAQAPPPYSSQQGYPPPTASQPVYAPPSTAVTGPAPAPPVSQPTLPPMPAQKTAIAPPNQSEAPSMRPPGTVPQAHSRMMARPANEFEEKLREAQHNQQTNVQLHPDIGLQQTELLDILQQQEAILHQKQQLEVKLQQLSHEQQKLQVPQASAPGPLSHHGATSQPNTAPSLATQAQQSQATATAQHASLANGFVSQPQGRLASQPGPGQGVAASMPGQPPVVPGQPHQHLASSLSSSGMSQQPMNSIPPTHGTTTLPIATSGGHAGYPSLSVRSAYQPASAVLTTDQLVMPASHPASQQQYHPGSIPSATTAPTVAMAANGDVAYPEPVLPSSVTAEVHVEQMRKVQEYQQQLLARHEQSKQVLEETKAEITRRRHNLLQRYPNLDLSRLENLGAKYLQNGTQPLPQSGAQAPSAAPSRVTSQAAPASQAAAPAAVGGVPGEGEGNPAQAASISALLATLASHPYYKATLSLPDGQQHGATMPPPATTMPPAATSITVASLHQTTAAMAHPDINMDTNLRKNKFDNIRKSLPFDQDESFQTPVRVYEAYAQKSLDTTSATEMTDGDTSTLTSRGSPSLPGGRQQVRSRMADFELLEGAPDTSRDTVPDSSLDTGGDTSLETSVSDVTGECLSRQNELRQQLALIQAQKEQILQRTQASQARLQQQEGEVKSKLAAITPAQQPPNTTPSATHTCQSTVAAVQKEFVEQPGRGTNLSTILEVDTPASSRPSDPRPGSTGQLPTTHTILEESLLEDVETQMESDTRRKRGQEETVAEYSGKNIADVLERAKRFESEVLEKLRRQTNAVLFDQQFDDSLEFSVSQRQVSGDSLSTGSLSTSSLSTGPLEDSSSVRPGEAVPRSADGSFQVAAPTSWASQLAQYKMPAADQSDPSFKLLRPESNRSSLEQPPANGQALVIDQNNRFKVYAAINAAQPGEDLGQLGGTEGGAQDVVTLLREMQAEFRSGEAARQALVHKLVQQQQQGDLQQARRSPSPTTDTPHTVARPFMPDDSKDSSITRPSDQSKSELSQYSFSDTTDASLSQASPVEKSRKSPVPSAAQRRSPIGDAARVGSPGPGARRAEGRPAQDVSGAEFSFMMTTDSQRSTSTPGEERQKRLTDGHTSTRSELPSEITLARSSHDHSTTHSQFQQLPPDSKSPPDGLDWSSSRDNTSSQFDTLSTDPHRASTELSTFSITSAEDSLNSKHKEKVPEKVKTYAVSKSGELISEHSDSDKSQLRMVSPVNNLTTFSISKQNDDSNNRTAGSGLSSYSMKDESSLDKTQSSLSQYTLASSAASDVKSSSLTTVTSDTSLNGTGASMFSMKESVSSSIDESGGGGNNYIQERFASLDNLISESKNLIEKHKSIIDKNKEADVAPPLPAAAPPAAHQTAPPPTQPHPASTTNTPSLTNSVPKPFYKSASCQRASVDTDQCVDRSRETSSHQSSMHQHSKDQSSTIDRDSLDYLTEHSSGILEEPLPEVTTLGSELSISEAFMKTEELSDSADSLKSFEKHELSETDSLTTSRSTFDDDSTQDHSKSGSVQDIVEARRHNFLVQSERRAAAAKERALARTSQDEAHVFRAVPVNVVAMPTLSMSVSTGSAEKGSRLSRPEVRAAKGIQQQPVSEGAGVPGSRLSRPEVRAAKGIPLQPVSQGTGVFDSQEQDSPASPAAQQKSLNRALQPRAPDSPHTPKDSGMTPTFKFENKLQRSSSADGKAGLGRLAGEIRQFGGTSGLNQKSDTPSPKKTPPQTLPKPVRGKPQGAVASTSSKPQGGAATTSGLSKTLSSWKKSRAITSKPTVSEREAPKNSIRVLPEDAPAPLTDEERRRKAEDEQYEKNIRAYNPRLFRLQHKLDTTTDDTDSQPEKHANTRDTRKKRRKKKRVRDSDSRITKQPARPASP